MRWTGPLIALLCVASGCSAQESGAVPHATKQPAAVETGTLDGAAYRIDIPANWNHGLVVYFHGYAVTPVQDGLQAWEALHASRYDLLITDNNMPRMTGLELAERTRLEGMKLPIIVASGAVGLPSGTDYDWLRVAARLQKPFATDELLKTVEQVLCAAGCLRQRRDNIFPMLLQRFSHITPYQHWGLNE